MRLRPRHRPDRGLGPLVRALWAIAFCLAVLYAAEGVVRLVA
ncbi:MAG TPA: hypothetical protein VF186_01700 [Gaiellaceae bacterium]